MGARTLLTSLLWLLGASTALALHGQTYTNSLMLIGCCVLVMLLWASLLWKKPRPGVAARVLAVLLLVGNLALIVWTSSRLPEARELQRQFNQHLGRKVT